MHELRAPPRRGWLDQAHRYVFGNRAEQKPNSQASGDTRDRATFPGQSCQQPEPCAPTPQPFITRAAPDPDLQFSLSDARSSTGIPRQPHPSAPPPGRSPASCMILHPAFGSRHSDKRTDSAIQAPRTARTALLVPPCMHPSPLQTVSGKLLDPFQPSHCASARTHFRTQHTRLSSAVAT